jgi:membrane associated rhomboid family serine protease
MTRREVVTTACSRQFIGHNPLVTGWQRGAPRRVIAVTLASMVSAFALGYLIARYLFPHIFGVTPGEDPVYFGLLGAFVCLGSIIGIRWRQRHL